MVFVFLTSLSVSSQSIHVAAKGFISFLFMAEQLSTSYTHTRTHTRIKHLLYPFMC